MKFYAIKQSIYRGAVIACTLIVLSACGSLGSKDQAGKDKVAPTLMETSRFLPVQEFDEKLGVYVHANPTANPYLEQKGRIHKDAVNYFIQARRYFKSEEFIKCNALLDDIIKLDDSLSGPWIMKADIAIKQEKTEEAIGFLNKALLTNPGNVNAYIRLAKLQRLKGDFIGAQNTYAKALAIWPDFPEAHLNIGILYDIYLNHPILAQKHMEAYLYLTGDTDQQAITWVDEVRSRSGMKATYLKADVITNDAANGLTE